MSKGKKILVIVDMQNDFVNGSLGSKEAKTVVPNIVKKVNEHSKEYDAIYLTRDIHFDNYADTLEGKKLPVEHCVSNTDGAKIVKQIWEAVRNNRSNFRVMRTIDKHTFASNVLIDYLSATCGRNDVIEFCGVCTDICVVSNVICTRAALPNNVIIVDSKCCAGTTVENHNAALKTMASCQIDVV